MAMSVKRYSHLVGVAAGMVLTLALSACQGLFQVPKPPVEATGTGEILEALPGTSQQVTVRLAQGVEGAEVYLRLADPCAKGTASCPGWDATRYPGVEHTRETFTLTASSPEATFRFTVAQDALPQGPFKWELVAVDGQGREWTTPVYLRILYPGDMTALEAINYWRNMVGVVPAGAEDLERSFECWQYGRYFVKNDKNPDYPHTTDPSKPFWTTGADRCARTSQTGSGDRSFYPARPLPGNILASELDSLVSVPIHRLAWLVQFSSPPTVWAGLYVERQEWEGRPGGVTYKIHEGAHLTGNPVPREILFPPPGSSVPLSKMGGEWPSPIQACNATAGPPSLPYRSLQATWAYPVGLPATVMTSAPSQAVETEVTYARLVRTQDGVEIPVCAFGSRQFWNQDPGATDTAVWYLRNYGVLVVLPKDPLDPGQEYEVEVRGLFNGSEKSYRWRFRVAENAL